MEVAQDANALLGPASANPLCERRDVYPATANSLCERRDMCPASANPLCKRRDVYHVTANSLCKRRDLYLASVFGIKLVRGVPMRTSDLNCPCSCYHARLREHVIQVRYRPCREHSPTIAVAAAKPMMPMVISFTNRSHRFSVCTRPVDPFPRYLPH